MRSRRRHGGRDMPVSYDSGAAAAVAARLAVSATDSVAASDAMAAAFLGCKAAVERYAPDAPAAVLDLALCRLLAYEWYQDGRVVPRGYANSLIQSGAAGLLSAYRVRRGGIVGATD